MIPRMFDSILYPVTTMIATAICLIIGQVATNPELIYSLLLPFIGAMIVAWVTMWMNPTPETRKVVSARVGAALFFGTLFPPILPHVTPDGIATFLKLNELIQIPHILLISGGMTAFVSYILSYPFCLRAYARAKANADAMADKALGAVAARVGVVVAKEAEKVAINLKQEKIDNIASDEVVEKFTEKLIAQTASAISDSKEAAPIIEAISESTAKKVSKEMRGEL